MKSYVSSVLLPANPTMSLRTTRELVTLAEAIDQLVSGKVAQTADLLVQRFKAVEAAHQDGNWNRAKHLELIPDAAVSAMTTKEREEIAKREKEELKLRAVIAAPRSPR
eukprot:4215763-Karenia_brevis.AAC.1